MTVAILGCGYVGLELCRQLSETDVGIVGVRRSAAGLKAVESTGATSIRADVTDPDTLVRIPDVDALVFAASSGGRDASAARGVYVDGLKAVIDEFGSRTKSPEQVVYTSSTGVYGDHDGDWVDETTKPRPTTEKTKVLAEAERVALERSERLGIDGTVVRLGGIYGPDRYHLDRYLERPVTKGYRNIIHRDDAAGILRFVLESADEDVILGVDNEPIGKWAFADWLAAECGVEPPPKQSVEERLEAGNLSERVRRRLRTSKRCSNDLLCELGYEYQYPTYREGYKAAIEAYRIDQS